MITLSRAEAWTHQAPTQTALDALQHLRWSVFPLDEQKRPPPLAQVHAADTPRRLAWKTYQSRLPTVQELTTWQQRYAPRAYAVITGALSGLVVLDFDGEQGVRTMHALDLHPHVRTGSGGYHVYFQHPGWAVPTLNGKSKRALGARWPGLDIRGDGGYAAFCGRNQNGPYQWLREPLPDALDELAADVRAFLGLLPAPAPPAAGPAGAAQQTILTPHERPEVAAHLLEQALRAVTEQMMGRNDAGFWLACQLRDQDYSHQEAHAWLLAYARRVPRTNSKGQQEPYTQEEAMASVRSAYQHPPRKRTQATAQTQGAAGSPPGTGLVQQTPEPADDLPEIIVGSEQLREVTDAALHALLRQEREQPTLFLQSARLVRVGRNEVSRPLITPMGVAEIKEMLTHAANFYRLRKAGLEGSSVKVPTSPPKEIAEQILARQTQQPYLPFPPLVGVVETPVLRPDGTILDTPGYDAATGLYYMPVGGMERCSIAADPSQQQCEAALALLKETIGEFPYAEKADFANALGLLLTPLVRPAIARHVPLALLDAPKPGTGKGLYADVVALIATGESVAVLIAPDNDEEWDKRITAMLLQGRSLICIDNLPAGRLQSAKLEAVLTADLYEGRMLGQSTMVKMPHRATWMATGNNITLGGDLPRRCYRIRLDPKVSQPWMRKGFRHEDLAGWVLQHRAELISALLTLARAWYVAGQPVDESLPTLGTFTPWVKIIGSILHHAGVEGFLANLHHLYEEADDESGQWEAFLEVWFALFTHKGRVCLSG
jgi:hypothetical protein